MVLEDGAVSRSRIAAAVMGCAVAALGAGCARQTAAPPASDAAASGPTPVAAVSAEQPQASPTEPAVVYTISKGSAVSFVGAKVTGRNAGGFHSFEGEIAVVDGRPELSSVRAVIDTTSLWADQPDLTRHLASDDFLAVESYPWASFTSTRVEHVSDETYRITGYLDLHGVVREIAFPATISVTPQEVRANADFKLDRMEFGIDFPGPADDLIERLVRVQFEVQAVPAG